MMDKKEFIKEPAREIPLVGRYDVAIAGGGIAGIAAALSARRAGAKRVLLIEKQYLLGGLATLGLVTIYLPICDGEGRQVSFGLAEELLKLSVSQGAEEDIPSCWKEETGREARRCGRRYMAKFNAGIFALLCEKQLLDEGVEILYGTSVCAVSVQGRRIEALICENKSGRQAFAANAFVDATGDADVCLRAGEDTAAFMQGNVLAGWYYALENGENTLFPLGGADIPDNEKTPAQLEEARMGKRYAGLDGRELSLMAIDSHRMTMAAYFQKGPFTQARALTALAGIPQVRMTRRIAGAYTLKIEDAFKPFADSVGMIGNWKKRGPVYEIPLSALYGRKIDNLYAAGRNISCTDEAWDVTRVIPACAVTGEAAGTAAVVGRSAREVQAVLQKRGVAIHL